MGLFDFMKKKNNNRNSTSSNTRTGINSSTSAQNNELKTPAAFYTDCVEDFHKAAMTQGVASKGLIFIPELLPMGEKAVLSFLKDSYFQMQFSSDPQTYYYLIMSLSLQAGIVFAAKWHEDFDELKNGYVEQIIEEGPADEARKLLEAEFPKSISANQGNPFYQKIFARWLAMHEPYWKLSDPREYTFKAMLAAYQLGISMILEKYGY